MPPLNMNKTHCYDEVYVHSQRYCYSVTLTHQLLFSVDFDIELCKKKTRPGWSCPPRYALKLVSKALLWVCVHKCTPLMCAYIQVKEFAPIYPNYIWNWLTLLLQISLPPCPFLAKIHWAGLNIQFDAREIQSLLCQSGASLVHNMAGSKKSLRLANKAPECKKITARQLCN